jgi:SAM-dependent methyltransferase
VDLKALQRNWDRLARKDPFWDMLTWPGKDRGRWAPDEFFATGVSEIDDVMRYLDSLDVRLRTKRALDFGCGVGRLTQPLAHHFDEVCGVDIAPSMISLAREHNLHGERCRYFLNDSDDLSQFGEGAFDFIYSKLTLQHMPPPYAKKFVAEFLRVLGPEGVALFQMAGEPTRRRAPAVRRIRRAVRWLVPEPLILLYRRLRYGHLIDMYGISPSEVLEVVQRNGGEVVDVVQDSSAGRGWTSFRYCVHRRQTDRRGEMQ